MDEMKSAPEDAKAAPEAVTDEELVRLAQSGDDAAEELLYDRYKAFVRGKARGYFLVGGDNEDLVQEGMIGFHKAIRDYRGEKQASFRTFAEMCVERQIITAIKSANRQKHRPLNEYASLNRTVYDEGSDGTTYLDVITAGSGTDPEELVIGQENFRSVENAITSLLTPLEREVLSRFLEGESYREIALSLHRSTKCIDNALQRIKRKMEKCLGKEQK